MGKHIRTNCMKKKVHIQLKKKKRLGLLNSLVRLERSTVYKHFSFKSCVKPARQMHIVKRSDEEYLKVVYYVS